MRTPTRRLGDCFGLTYRPFCQPSKRSDRSFSLQEHASRFRIPRGEPEPRGTANWNAWKHLRRPTALLAPAPLRRLCRSGRDDVSRERGPWAAFRCGSATGRFGSVGASNRASEIQLHDALRLTHAFAVGKFNPLVRVEAPELTEDLIDRFRDLRFPSNAWLTSIR